MDAKENENKLESNNMDKDSSEAGAEAIVTYKKIEKYNSKKMNPGRDIATYDVDLSYGCQVACFSHTSPRYPLQCMQKINNVKGVLLFFCISLFLEGVISGGLFNVIVSTLEKRFNFQSAESGLIGSSFDVFTCFALITITIYGSNAFKPMWVGWGTFCMGVGCILFSVPHLTAPIFVSNQINVDLCGNETEEVCSGSSLRNYRYFFMVAYGIIGMGSTPFFTTAIAYLDENVKQTNSALYNGIYYSMGALGPAVGYVIGSFILNVHTNIRKRVDIIPSSSEWIGAWWLGFLAIGIICLIISVFIMMFPRSLPGTARFRRNRNTENSIKMKDNTKYDKGRLKDFPAIIWNLIRNFPYVLFSASSCLNFAYIYGYNTFGTKHLESLYGLPASQAGLYFGIAAIFAAAGGQFIGGFVITKMQLSVNGIIKFMIICSALSTATTFGFLLSCEDEAFAGGTVPYQQEPDNSFDEKCSSNCSCGTEIFKPVCGQDDITYFSPCFAGCSSMTNSTHFEECSCVKGNLNTTISQSKHNTASAERCTNKNCPYVTLFILTVFFGFSTTLLTTTPNLQVTIRCVPFSYRTQALAIQRLLITLLGSIPGRLLTGEVLDLACVSWSSECGQKGTCRSYRRADISKYMFILVFSEKALNLLLIIIAYFVYEPVENTTGDEGTDMASTDCNVIDNDDIRINEQHDLPVATSIQT